MYLGCGAVMKQQQVNLHEIDNKFMHGFKVGVKSNQWPAEEGCWMTCTQMMMALLTTLFCKPLDFTPTMHELVINLMQYNHVTYLPSGQACIAFSLSFV